MNPHGRCGRHHRQMIRLFGRFVCAGVALGILADANAAERLQNIVRRVSVSEAQTATNSFKSFRLAGTVVDADGKSVVGAIVECYQNSAGRSPFDRADTEVKQFTTTGAKGMFEFRVSPASTVLLARKPGLAVTWSQYRNQEKDTTEKRLVFMPSSNLAGVVVDETDKPVPDAEVWVSYACSERPTEEGNSSYAYLSGKPSHDCFTTRTGGDGRFAFQGFPTNTSADLAVSKPGKVLRELQREYISPETMRCRAGQQDIKLVVEPGGSIAGKVVTQESSQPLSGVRLWAEGNRPGNVISWQREPALAGADGTFRLADLAAGSYQLRATFGTNPVPEWVAETVSVSVETGQTTHDVQVLATRGGLLEVALLGKADRQPLAEVSVNVYKAGYQTGVSSGTNGIALLRVPAGNYQVSASKQNSRSEGTAVTAETGRTNRIEIELNPPPRIAGVVRDPSGTAMPGLALTVFPQWGRSEGEVKTDARGRYELPWDPQRFGGLMQTPYLIARDVGRNLAAAQDIDASTTTLDLRLEPGLVVVGRVEDVHGKPLSNASVRVYLWSVNSGSQFDEKPIRTDAQGRFEATAMPPGRKYSLDATAKGYGSANENILEDAETNRIELPPCVLKVADLKVAGEVVDADEKPVARANVHMYGQGQPNGSVRTDDKGRFRFEEVCEGSVQLSVSSQRAYGNARAEAGDTNVVIHLGASPSDSVRETPKRPSLNGKPLPDLALVELGSAAAPTGKPVLLCLFDVEQRPSRRFVKQLAEHYDALRQQGLTVLGLQAAVTTADAFKEWQDSNPVPFPVGRLAAKADNTKWASEVDSLPWLILTDGERRVTAEGFTFDELDAKLKRQAKP